MNWLNRYDGVSVGFNLQSSAWNLKKGYGRHYINIGCNAEVLCADGKIYNKDSMTVASFPLEFRYRVLNKDDTRADDAEFFHDGVSMPVDERRHLIQNSIEKEIYPITEKMQSIDWLASSFKSGFLAEIGCYKRIKFFRDLS